MKLKYIQNNLMTIPLEFEGIKYKNIFKDKNNKTLKETISHKRYMKFSSCVYEKYSEYLETAILKV